MRRVSGLRGSFYRAAGQPGGDRAGLVSLLLLGTSVVLIAAGFLASERLLALSCSASWSWLPAFTFFAAGGAALVSMGVGIRALRREYRDGRGWWGALLGLPTGLFALAFSFLAAVASVNCA